MRILIPALLALAACDGPAATNTAMPAATPAGLSAVQQRVVDLSPRQLNGVLFRAIRDGGAECQGVGETVRQADQEGRPVWVARCTDSATYLIAIGPDGTAQVTKISGERARG